MKTKKDLLIDFVDEYDKLCKKHKMFISSCGCCFGVIKFGEEINDYGKDHYKNLIKDLKS